jgi:NTP pyrophosphatase (non-canonical NTP hydrolase)
MDMNEYQSLAMETKFYPSVGGHGIVYPALKLSGEVGEFNEKVGKVFRDKGGIFTQDDRYELAKELGDVMWYIAALARELGFCMTDIADMNLYKLKSRKERGALSGNGDNR